MKKYCIRCKYYSPEYSLFDGGIVPSTCGAPQNCKDTNVAPRSVLKREPHEINKNNNCKYYVKKLSLKEKIKRWFS